MPSRPTAVPAALLLAGLILACGGIEPPQAPTATAADPPAAASDYDWQLPPGFPTPAVPPDNPMSAEKVELGRRLFYDRRLSGNGTFSCASCHRQELAFTDGRARAVGSTGELHSRSSMSLANVAYSRTLTWADPDLDRLEEQMLTPMFGEHPIELGLAGREAELIERLEADASYRHLFRRAFPAGAAPSVGDVTRAIAAFQRTLISGTSDYDRYVYLGESDALPVEAKRGMRLFFSARLGCSECHAGFTFSGPIRYRDAEDEPVFHNTGLYDVDGLGGYPAIDTGLHRLTGEAPDMGRFRAPTLRNVAVTAPYMHDGSIAELAEVIDHYARGGRELLFGELAGDGARNRYKSDIISGFELSDGEKEDLLAFLDSLTDETFLTDSRHADPFADHH